MSFSRNIQWYHSHADPIWPDSTFKPRRNTPLSCRSFYLAVSCSYPHLLLFRAFFFFYFPPFFFIPATFIYRHFSLQTRENGRLVARLLLLMLLMIMMRSGVLGFQVLLMARTASMMSSLLDCNKDRSLE
jgi:hypothetical protein